MIMGLQSSGKLVEIGEEIDIESVSVSALFLR